MFQTLISSKKKIRNFKEFQKNILKHFGPGSNYWKNLKLRKKYKKSEMEKAYERSVDPSKYLRDYTKYQI